MGICSQYHAVHLGTTARGFELVQVIEFVQVQYGPVTRSQQHWECKIGRSLLLAEGRLQKFGVLIN